MGYRGSVLMEAGVDEAAAAARQAPFYRRENPEGSVCAVLGAGNVSSIPATDVLHKLFAEGRACVLKMNPVNEYVGPFLERGLAPLVQNGFLRVEGADVLVDRVH